MVIWSARVRSMLGTSAVLLVMAAVAVAGAPRDGQDRTETGRDLRRDVRSVPAADLATGVAPTARQPSELATKPAGDSFELDTGRVTESVKADGTVIVQLNGEGLEKLSLTQVDGQLRVSCGSALESGARRAPDAPGDFRRAGRAEGRHAHR